MQRAGEAEESSRGREGAVPDRVFTNEIDADSRTAASEDAAAGRCRKRRGCVAGPPPTCKGALPAAKSTDKFRSFDPAMQTISFGTHEISPYGNAKSCAGRRMVKLDADAPGEMKSTRLRPQAFRMAKPYFTRGAHFTNPGNGFVSAKKALAFASAFFCNIATRDAANFSGILGLEMGGIFPRKNAAL